MVKGETTIVFCDISGDCVGLFLPLEEINVCEIL